MASRRSWAFSALTRESIRPNRLATRRICVSTGSTGCPIEKSRTHPAVFGPTPGRLLSHSLASAGPSPSRKLRSRLPLDCLICCSIDFIRAALISPRPPILMARAMSVVLASATSSQVGKALVSAEKALWELASEVFCDSTVLIRVDRGSRPALHLRGP